MKFCRELNILKEKENIFSQQVYKNGGSSGFNIVKDGSLSGSLIVIDPYMKMKTELVPFEGKKLLYVIKGDVSVIVDNRNEKLGPGDSLYLTKGSAAQLKNEGGDSAELLVVRH